MIRAISKKVGQLPEIKDVKNQLDAFQKCVGGYIEIIPIAHDVLLVLNEEGKIRDLEKNFDYYMEEQGETMKIRRLLDTIHGNVLFVSSNGEDFSSLNERQTDFINACFRDTGNAFVIDKKEVLR